MTSIICGKNTAIRNDVSKKKKLYFVTMVCLCRAVLKMGLLTLIQSIMLGIYVNSTHSTLIPYGSTIAQWATMWYAGYLMPLL